MYSQKIKTPVYTPKGDKPDLSELVDETKYQQLSRAIAKADVDSKTKYFLRKAASRHFKFDYVKIAEYYAHAPKEVQELFEDSGLVIIDFDKGIENGFVMMNKRLMEIRKNEPEV